MVRDLVRLEGDREPTKITNVLANGELTVDPMPGRLRRYQDVVLIDQRLRSLLEGLTILVGPPVAQCSVAVTGGTLIIEAVSDLVSDHRANAAVVDGVICMHVKMAAAGWQPETRFHSSAGDSRR